MAGGVRSLPARPPAEVWDRPDMTAALTSRDIGGIVKIYRRWSGASQQHVSMLVGFPQSRVSAIERGRTRVESLATFEAVADGLAMPAHARTALGLAHSDVTPSMAAASSQEEDGERK